MLKYISIIALLYFLTSCKHDPYIYPGTEGYKDISFTNYFKRTSGWVAGDGAYSIPLNNGNSLWVFGDSYIDDYDPATSSVPCIFNVRSAAMLMGISDPSITTTLPGTGGSNSYFLPANGSNWTWPGPGYQNGDTIYVFVNTDSQANTDTPRIAKILLPGYTFLSYYNIPYINGINFTNSIVQESDYYYVYGTKGNGFGNDLFVARYPANNIYGQWQYHGSNGWSNDINSITKIWDEFTSSFNVCKIKNKYLLITTEFSVGCDQGKNIYVAGADNPAGPFMDQHSVWQVDDTLNGHYPVFYIANPHPEYDNGHNELLITYSINCYSGCFNTCINGRMDPNVYRPRAIRVPYSILDRSL